MTTDAIALPKLRICHSKSRQVTLTPQPLTVLWSGDQSRLECSSMSKTAGFMSLKSQLLSRNVGLLTAVPLLLFPETQYNILICLSTLESIT